MRMTLIALPITSAGRFWPLGPLGKRCPCILLVAKHTLVWVIVPVILLDEGGA
jgi:hypothetical protein